MSAAFPTQEATTASGSYGPPHLKVALSINEVNNPRGSIHLTQVA